MSLIEKLYSKEIVDRIKDMYLDDDDSRDMFYEMIGMRILECDDIFLDTKPLDVLTLICLNSKFATSKEECQSVALIIHKRITDTKVLPYVTEDFGMDLAEKTLIALSFHRAAMEFRWSHKGSPPPKFYREISKKIFYNNGHYGIADHHEQWESFLGEIFI